MDGDQTCCMFSSLSSSPTTCLSKASLAQETAGMRAESHRLERLFHQLDTNGDGKIDIHELFQGLNRLGYAHISEEQVEVRPTPYFLFNVKLLWENYPLEYQFLSRVATNCDAVFYTEQKFFFNLT